MQPFSIHEQTGNQLESTERGSEMKDSIRTLQYRPRNPTANIKIDKNIYISTSLFSHIQDKKNNIKKYTHLYISKIYVI